MLRPLLITLSFLLLFAETHAQTWEELNNKVIELYNEGDYAGAIPVAEKALKQAEKALGKDHSDYGKCLNNLSELYRRMGQYEKALPLYLEALENTEKTLGKDHAAYARVLNNLAGLYASMDQYDQALPLYLKALQTTEKSLGKDHPDYGKCLNNLAGLYYSMGQYDQALTLYLEVLQNTEKNLSKAHSAYGSFLNNLAGLYYSIGQYDKALPLYIEAIQNTEKNLGKNHPDYGIRINHLARLYASMCQYDLALPLYLEASQNTEKTLGKDHPDYGNRLNDIALLYVSMGQSDKALPLYLEALKNTEKNLGKNHSTYRALLSNFAELYKIMDQYDKALSLYLEVLQNAEKNLSKDHQAFGSFLNNLAGLYYNMGQYEKALPLYLEASQKIEKNLGRDHPAYGTLLNNLAQLYASMGQYDQAMPMILAALQNNENNQGKDHPSYGGALNNLALLHENMSQYDLALPRYLEALQNTYNQLEQAFSFMSENEKEAFQEKIGYNFEVYQSFFCRYCKAKPDVAAHAFDIELATKGMILQSGIQSRQAIMNSGDAAAIAKYEEWSLLRGILAKQYSLPISERRSDISEVEAKAEKAEAELSRLSNNFRESKAMQQTRWQDVQQALIPGEVAIEFSSFQYRNKVEWTDSTLYMALILRPGDQYPRLVTLFEQKQLDTLLQNRSDNDARFFTQLYRGAELENGNEKQVNHGKQLYDLIWKPLEPHIAKGSKVYFAPSGRLHQIAFAAIPVDEKQLLCDVYRLEQVSSTAMIVRKNQDKSAMPQNIALFGGIQYDSKTEELLAQANKLNSEDRFSRSLPADLSRGNESWSYLSGTLQEVKQIEKLAITQKVKTQTYTGSQAIEEQVKALAGAQSPDVLHIATHGFSYPAPEQERKAGLQMMDMEDNIYRASDNPLQRAGLLFAGANRAWAGKDVPEGLDDGILSAYETSHLYFGNTQLMVLSACETGLGDIKGSEGVFGLQRAFKQAGAGYLLMSLWKVPDKETAEFMASFYEKWFSGLSIPEAFKNTQIYLKEKYQDEPYKWAAFVLIR